MGSGGCCRKRFPGAHFFGKLRERALTSVSGTISLDLTGDMHYRLGKGCRRNARPLPSLLVKGGGLFLLDKGYAASTS